MREEFWRIGRLDAGFLLRLRSSSPFWPIRDGISSNYPPVKTDLRCDVAVIGGGLCGAMVAHHLSQAGLHTVVVDKREIGLGSTAASTALVLCEVDMHLSDLIQLRGESEAVRSYRACLRSVSEVERIARSLGCPFESKDSLYLASRERDVAVLEKEYNVRRAFGFDVDFLKADEISRDFSFRRPAALFTRGEGEVDPFMFARSLVNSEIAGGRLEVFDRTEVLFYEPVPGGVLLLTDRGFRIRAEKAVFATGYETARFLPRKVVKLKSSFAIATEPIPDFTGWGRRQCLVWETRRPYLYLRTTTDGRIIAGGEDEDFVNPAKRDRLVSPKAGRILSKLRTMFPKMDIEAAYAWAGTFGETEDSLPCIGELQEFPNAYFALCYGANGTNFAVLAAGIIRDLCLGKSSPDEELFRFGRLEAPGKKS
jgi:glycine/D-amino acid oxidase-like deaminating enzyme